MSTKRFMFFLHLAYCIIIEKKKKIKMKKIGYFKRRCSIPRAEKLFRVAAVVVEQEQDRDFQVLQASFQFYPQHSMNKDFIDCL